MNRREFARKAAFAGTAALLGVRPDRAHGEPPPETTRIRLRDLPAACLAPQYVAQELLKAEGFTDVQYVKTVDGSAASLNRAVLAGEIHLALNDPPGWLRHIDSEEALVIVGGIHAGCYELFGGDRVRSIRDLKGKTVAVPELHGGRTLFVSMMAKSVGLDPSHDINWAVHSTEESMRLFAEGKVDAVLGFPPEPQELRAKKLGRVLVNTLTDRPWSQYFCCMVGASREFVQKYPVATKRALRAVLKAADLCALEPERAARLVVERGVVPSYDYTLQMLKEIGYRQWRQYNPEETIRFYALRLHEAGFVKSNPQKIIARATDWRFFNELKRELKA